jgi:excisionase family DNA binding protein
MATRTTALPRGELGRLVTDVNDASRLLDCSRDKVYELIKSGELQSYVDGHSRKIIVASIERYVAHKLAASKKFTRSPIRGGRPLIRMKPRTKKEPGAGTPGREHDHHEPSAEEGKAHDAG